MARMKDVIDAAEYMRDQLQAIANKDDKYCQSTQEILERYSWEMLVMKNNLSQLQEWEGFYGIL